MKIFDDQLVVVTGGAGFIGSGVIKALNDKGFNQILVIDDLGTDERWKNLVGKQFSDIIPIKDTFSFLASHRKEVQAYIHLGANSSTLETNASHLLENNYRYSVDLCTYALKNECRFIYASSAATYGDGLLGFDDSHDEIQKLRPLNMYGYSKQLFDLWAKENGLLDQIVGLKYFNVFGPNEWHKGRMASAIVKFVDTIHEKGEVQLFASNDPNHYKDGEQCRDFVYVKDVAAITIKFLQNEVGGLFNVGCGEGITWNRFAKAVFKAMHKPESIKYIPMPKDLDGKYQNRTVADLTKLRNVFGDELCFWQLEMAVSDYVQNYLLAKKYW
jgi:ADP-L-glycero-D-manno-heptose-6-epimerase